MSNEALLNLGTKLNLETSGASLSDGSFHECNEDDRQPGDNTGYPLGIFEFVTAAGGFSAAPTAGAVINIYEQKINSGANDAPDVDSNYKNDFLCSLPVDPADAQQYLTSTPVPIARLGGKYWVEWVDGGSGTASVDSGWTLDLTPCTYGTA